VVDAAKASFTRVQAALEALKEGGRAYDQKFKVSICRSLYIYFLAVSCEDLPREHIGVPQSSVSSSVQTAKGGISSATTTVSSSIEHIVVATRERSSSSFEQLKEYLFSTQKSITDSAAVYGHGAVGTSWRLYRTQLESLVANLLRFLLRPVVAGGVVTKAEQLDERYGVVGSITGAVAAVTEKVVGLDRALGVSERALMVDEKVSGGMGASLVSKGLELVNTSVGYVTDALQQAKVTAAEANGVESTGAVAAVEESVQVSDSETKVAAPVQKEV